MVAYYDEIEIEDMLFDDIKGVYHYPCPCGDRFEISRAQLANYEDIATCPSCSLIIRVIYDPVSIVSIRFTASDSVASWISKMKTTGAQHKMNQTLKMPKSRTKCHGRIHPWPAILYYPTHNINNSGVPVEPSARL
jgi:diphthamide biosynthesis protein 3